jgi:hypothetical protein
MSWYWRAIGVVGAAALVVTGSACGGSSKGGAHSTPSSVPIGTVADSGFRPNQNGLPFQNYGGTLANGAIPLNMTASDVQEMFGDAVCADAQSRKCDLIPEAQAWLDETNQAMAGGHCYGFSVLAELLWLQQVKPTTFGAQGATSLQIANNASLQRQIAYDWTLQTLESVQSKRVTGTPNQVLNDLISALKPNPTQTYTMTFWKSDFTGGHAVTPYAVDNKGGGIFDVLIYDNNWPGQSRAVVFNTNTDTWSYNAAINPDQPDSLYEGNAQTKTISLSPTSPGLGTQKCPFCGTVPAQPASGGPANTEEIYLDGSDTNHANLIIVDDAGHRLGYVNGTFVNEIPGASIDELVSNEDWTNKVLPDYFVPADNKYTITIDGSVLTAKDTETLGIIGPSYDLSVKNIAVNPGDKDSLVIEPDAVHVSYTSSRPESPTIDIGVSDISADYGFEISGVSDRPGSTLNISLPPEGTSLRVQTVGAGTTSTVGFGMRQETERGVQVFQHKAISLPAGDAAEFQFGSWTGAGQDIPVITTHGGTQTTQLLSNQVSA